MRFAILLVLAIFALSVCDAGKKGKDKGAGRNKGAGKGQKEGKRAKKGGGRGDSCPTDPNHQIYQTSSGRPMCCRDNIIYMGTGGPLFQFKNLNSNDMWEQGACDKSENHIFKIYGVNSCRCVKGDLCPPDDSSKYRANGDETVTMCCKFNSQYYRDEGAKYKKLKLRRNTVRLMECPQGEIFKIHAPHECGCEEYVRSEPNEVDQAAGGESGWNEKVIKGVENPDCVNRPIEDRLRLVAATINGKRYHLPEVCLSNEQWYFICNKEVAQFASIICKKLNLCGTGKSDSDCSNSKGEVIRPSHGTNRLNNRIGLVPSLTIVGPRCEELHDVLAIQCPIEPVGLEEENKSIRISESNNEV